MRRNACSSTLRLARRYEDSGDYARSFEHYAQGNALHRAAHPYDAELNSKRIAGLRRTFTREFFRDRAGYGCDSPDPIFIVGMPRAGSTLLEQILSSHSQVEGTTELPEIITMAKDLRAEADSADIAVYAEVLATRSAAELKAMGERYLERTRVHRKTDRPFFIDKMPNNFLHVGMIHAVLPNAKIIDARRHPLGCCFSNFKQHYARGQNFSYSLTDMGRFYRDYVELMAHFDEVLPRARPPRHLRAHGRGHRSGSAQAARVLRSAVRAGLPAFLRERAPGAHGERRAGPPPDLPGRRRAVAALRAVARAAQGSAGSGAGGVSRRAGDCPARSCAIAGRRSDVVGLQRRNRSVLGFVTGSSL